MSAGKHDIVVEQGATFHRRFTYTDDADAPIDLTGWTARMQVRETFASNQELAEWTTETFGLTITDPVNGVIELLIEADESQAWTFRSGVYDIELVQPAPGDDVIRLVKGTFTLDPEVTR